MSKLFDLRFVIGAFFTVVGLLLLVYGFTTADDASNAHAVNKWCGSVFLIFGVLMIILSFQKDAHDELLPSDDAKPSH
jgi:putative Mn2+ efflux pump MntP